MKGLFLNAGRLVHRRDLPDPVPGPGEALLSVRQAGICGTDLALLGGYAGFTGVPGHEFVGEVLDGPGDWQGVRVTAEINIACGECDLCLAGLSNHCSRRQVVGIREHQGAFAEQLIVPVTNLWRIPAGLTDEQAVLVEPLAAALQVIEQIEVGPDTRTLVVGAGRLAQLIVQVLRASDVSPEVLVRSPARRASFAGQADCCVDRPNGLYDLVVEASGSEEGLTLALEHVRPRGTVVLKSTYWGMPAVDLSAVVVHEITLIGSRCGPFGRAIEWLASGKIETRHLRFERFPLEAYAEAFARAGSPDVYKVIFEPGY